MSSPWEFADGLGFGHSLPEGESGGGRPVFTGFAEPSRHGTLNAVTDAFEEHQWLTVPDLVERFGISQGRVRRLIEDKHLLAVRRNGVLAVPEIFLDGNEPLGELRGTIFVLGDDGFTDDEAMRWLLEVDDVLGVAPITALREGRKTEVRRVAQALA